MSTTIILTFISVIVISLISFIGVFTLSFSRTLLNRALPFLVSLAIGALLGDAFIHLIPERLAEGNATTVSLLIIAGMLTFFVFESILHWHHHHDDSDAALHSAHAHPTYHGIRPTGQLVLISDGLHNLLDGLIIGASFLAGTDVGIATTIAVILHEIPQEIGDFGVLVHAGFSVRRALCLNFISALCAVLGAMIALVLGTLTESVVHAIVPLAAGGFIYIASSDLIPELHAFKNRKQTFLHVATILVGVALMFGLIFIEGEEGHGHGAEREQTHTTHEDTPDTHAH